MTGASEYVRGEVAPGLAAYGVTYSGYRTVSTEPDLHRGLPSPALTVILTLEDPLDMAAHPDPSQRPGRYEALVGGLHTTPALIRHDGRQSGVQLSFSPLGARALLGVPAGELAGIDVDAAQVWPGVESVLDRLRTAATWEDRFRILDAVLLARAGRVRHAGVPAEVAHAWKRLVAGSGSVPVPVLAAETGYSERWLGARFRQEVGLGPKSLARVVRFDRARRTVGARVGAGRPPALAEVAAACGYYDQAHLAREFGGFAGLPPTAWAEAEFRNIQATAGAGAGSSDVAPGTDPATNPRSAR